MKDFVVCISDAAWHNLIGPIPPGPHPVKGEIYEVMAVEVIADRHFYHLRGLHHGIYDYSSFRPVDNTYGELITEIIEKQLQLEPA
jgi:hypothetical protein